MKPPSLATATATAAAWTTLLLALAHLCHASTASGAPIATSDGRRLASQLDALLQHLDGVKSQIDAKLFLYQTPAYQWIPSSVYRYADLRASLEIMATEGVAGKKLYVGEEDVENGYVLGLVGLAAFLAQSMKETIQYDACDENSWDFVNGKYPLSNACGQLGQSYQDYHCPDHEKHMECPVDPDMSIKAVTHAKWYGAPGPLFCGPKSEYPTTGFWDHGYECNKSWASPPETCDVYEGQKAGRYDNSIKYASTGGRTDVEGCCWWGRGVIQTTGVCNFGKLNYFLGAGAKKDGRDARYPKIDFCKDPEVICASPEHKELKWIAGEFYWMESVQSYNVDGWDYTTELLKFVQGGMTGTSFIDGVSGIVNRGCHNPPCGTGPVDGASERAENFHKVLNVFFGGSPPAVGDLSASIGLPATPGDAAALTPGAVQAPGSSSNAAAKWYPNYDAQYALGKCVNEVPAPSGRPSYDSGEECCNKAYAHQASGACLASLPGNENQSASPGSKAPQLDSSPEDSASLVTSPGSSDDTPTQAKPKPSRPTVPLSPAAAVIASSTTFVELENSLESAKDELDTQIFLYQTPAFQWVPSSVYRYDDFKESVDVMATEGVAGKKLYIGDDVDNGHVFGLVNIAAFLAQSMKETIQYDACDENSWDLVNGKYPLSNACGQLGQSYQDYHCPDHEKHMECPVDPDLSVKAVTHAKWYGAPGPLFCGPKSEYPTTGFWDHGYECNKAWASPPETCDVYEGQKAGRYDNSIGVANTAGRTDVEGCCYWGRGVIQTTGVCNFGKLNYFLGAGAKKDGRNARYPDIDFCKDPEAICASPEYKELKWIAGEFYWMESVQSYNVDGWDYTTELQKFVRGGMTGTAFIDAVSGIVNRGCHNPPCGTGAVDGTWERAENFKKVLDAFFGGSSPEVGVLPPADSEEAPEVIVSSVDTGQPGASTQPDFTTPDSGLTADASADVAAQEKWYPNYDAQYALGKCINNTPAPGGRPSYDSGEECCQKAYAYQASGACLASLPGSPGSTAPQLDSSPEGSASLVASPGSSDDTLTQAKPKPSRPTVPLSPAAAVIASSMTFVELENSLESAKNELDTKIFLYESPNSGWVPSSVYRYDDFKESVDVMATEGVAGKKLYIGEDVDNGHVYGLVNIAAFLAQSMKETIQYDACDENSWDLVNGKYPLSNACGQLGQSYQDYHCPDHEKHMECPIDKTMSVKAVTHAKWYGAPGPLFCGPKSEYPTTGFWDHGYACNKAWAYPPETCDVYEGQKAGRYDNSVEVANTAGRTDVEGCCYWGRGVIQTTGVCNFGKLNYFLGAGAKNDGRNSRYPEIDFCKDPEAICASPEYKELKWIAGEFYWMESVQSYNVDGWDYATELQKFVRGGMTGMAFIDAVSGIVNRGCHNPPCGTGEVDGTWERSVNFKKVLDAFFGGSPPNVGEPSTTSSPETQNAATSLDPSIATAGSDAALTDVYVVPSEVFTSPSPYDSAPPPIASELSSLSDSGTEADLATPGTTNVYIDEGPPSSESPLSETGTQEDPATFAEAPGPTVWRPEDADVSMAAAFIAGTLCDTYQCRRNSNFVTYNCGAADISDNALVLDILFQYEVTVFEAVQTADVLPGLKKAILNNLAATLQCQFLPRRHLAVVGEDVILGYQSTQGSDTIDREKGSCSESEVSGGEKCIPLIGHLAAYVQPAASVDSVLSAKDAILHVIQYSMAGDFYADLANSVVYVGEHKGKRPKPLSNSSSKDNDEPSNSGKSAAIAIVLVVIAIIMGVAIFVFDRRRRGRDIPKVADLRRAFRRRDVSGSSESGNVEKDDDDLSVSNTAYTDTRVSNLDLSEASRVPYREDRPLDDEARLAANDGCGDGNSSFDLKIDNQDSSSAMPGYHHSIDELDIHVHREAHAETKNDASSAMEGNGSVNFVIVDDNSASGVREEYTGAESYTADEENVLSGDGGDSYGENQDYAGNEGTNVAEEDEGVVFGLPHDGMFYTGQIDVLSRLPHGLGTLRSDGDGRIYEGEWHFGELLGNESNPASLEGHHSEEHQNDGGQGQPAVESGWERYIVGSDDMSRASYMEMD